MSRLDHFKLELDRAREATRKAMDNENEAYALWDAERIRITGCNIIGHTVEFCTTCGLDAINQHLCPHQPKKEGDA